MSRTITLPIESVVSFNKHGIVKIEHLKTIEVEISQEVTEALLQLMGTTPEEVIEAASLATN